MNLREQMEQVYRDMPLDSIPWNLPDPPAMLVEAIESGKIKPCKAVDMGCGAGNYAVWLAKHGFDVTGIDISERAIAYARDMAIRNGVSCSFEAADLLRDMKKFHEHFDFAYDWEVLHHIFPEDRESYLSNVHNLLRQDGMYFSICFSEKNSDFGGEGKYRKTPIDTTLYFSSKDELRDLFDPLFHICELNTVEIKGKYNPHLVNVAWLKRR
ncbi:MAG: class I SAM-dependent methyltransferase [Candidatus Electryonea clarkiae]|nr:class I SAM-dependent methyltransferase [Candidatus Electryonea clarkiae]MDP8285161.1 class I SAM-dependent methyltransferase [Candidatus Electryonea clarkiae]